MSLNDHLGTYPHRILDALATGRAKKRFVGVLLFAAILALFLLFNRFPKIDTISGDLDAVTGETIQCFQGFCIEQDPTESFVERWVDFSVTYLRAVLIGMTFAFLAAGLTEAFFFPPGSAAWLFAGSPLRRTLSGMALGPVLNLCAACIVPVSASIHRRGGGIEGAIAAVQASATMNFLAIGMVFFVFTPILGFSRLILAVVGALLLGRIVAVAVRWGRQPEPAEDSRGLPLTAVEVSEAAHTWKQALQEGFRDWAKATITYQVRLWPIMVAAGFASGLAIQWLDASTVGDYLGNDAWGVVIAATFGILVNVPLLFEIPLVAVLLILGMGIAPAATLLFTVAAGGPVTFWGLAQYMPKRAIATFATATWVLGTTGGLVVLGVSAFIWKDVGEGALKVAKANTAAHEVKRLGRTPPTFVEMAEQAGIDFRHTRDDSFFNLGGGAAAGDFNNDGWIDVYVTNSRGASALFRNNGDGTFSDIARPAGVAELLDRGHGAAWGDYDNDGKLDLYVATWGSSKLFRNNGNDTFTNVTADAGVADPAPDYRTTGAVWGDYDQDGFLDLLVVRHVNSPLEQFTPTGIQANLLNRCRTKEFLADPRVPRGVVLLDPKIVESRPDLRRDFSGAARPLQLYRNNGDGTFADVTRLLGEANTFPSNLRGAGFKPSFLDYDNDGDLDIYVVNDFGVENFPNVLWRNDGPDVGGGWKFRDVSASSGANAAMYGMGLAAGDYDNDGDLDFYITDMGASRFLENRNGVFTDVTERTGTGRGVIPENGEVNHSIGWGATFADLDNDGWLDLYYVAGYLDSDPCMNHPNQPNAVFMNKGDGTFVDVSRASNANDSGVGREVVVADFNNDGLLDLYLVNMGSLDGTPGVSRLYLNSDKAGNTWLQVKLLATAGNRFAIGARVTVTVDGVTRVQHVGLGQGHMSQSVTPVHFGLGRARRVELVEIHWPNGTVQSLRDVLVNQIVTVIESY